MKVELIPVLEVSYPFMDLVTEEKNPEWKYPDEWIKIYNESYKRAGFKYEFTPYCPGLQFYRPSKIHDENLKKIVLDQLDIYLDDESGDWERDNWSSLNGGYVLRINDNDVLFPQCCGGLSEISAWKQISLGDENVYWEQHPNPVLKLKGENTQLICINPWEPFIPETKEVIWVNRKALKEACENTYKELAVLAKRIDMIKDIRVTSFAKMIDEKFQDTVRPSLSDLLIYG
jgi:hypothetical protein